MISHPVASQSYVAGPGGAQDQLIRWTSGTLSRSKPEGFRAAVLETGYRRERMGVVRITGLRLRSVCARVYVCLPSDFFLTTTIERTIFLLGETSQGSP